MMRKTGFALALLWAGVSVVMGQETQPAQTRPSAPKTTTRPVAPKDQPQKVTVVSVSGPAQKLIASAEKQQWVALKKGETLDEMTMIRTGLRAKVVLRFADRAEVVVNNATKMGIGEFRKRGKLAKTRLGLKYGTIRASIERGRGPNDFEVATPVATLSVQGSGANVSALIDSPTVVQSFSGLWRTTTSAGTKTVFAGEATSQTLTQWAEIAQQQRDTQMGAAGQTPKEQKLLRNNSGGRGIIGLTPSNSRTGGGVLPPPPVPTRLCPPTPPPPIPPPVKRAS